MAHLARVEAAWPRPFTIRALDEDINVLVTPPKQVMEILQTHARRYYDRTLIKRLCKENDWDEQAVTGRYAEGIEWETIRRMMRDSSGTVNAREKCALLNVVCGGFWPEERRWRHGLRSSPTCEACGMEVATPKHRIHGCEAMQYDKVMWRLMGRTKRIAHETSDTDAGLEPLVSMGLPPVSHRWAPVELEYQEGHIGIGSIYNDDDEMFGDGSGYRQQQRTYRVATWAVVRPSYDGDARRQEKLRGVVPGWAPTVPRGELTAYIQFLKHAGPSEQFIGDCLHIIEGARHGIQGKLTGSSNANADLWREARRLQRDRGEIPVVHKTRAHRTWARAAADGDEPMRWWRGNAEADEYAKSLARRIAEADTRHDEAEKATLMHEEIIARVAMGAAWAYRHWPDAVRTPKKAGEDDGADGEDLQEEGHILYRGHADRLECRTCRKYAVTARGRRKLAKEKCAGDIKQLIHDSHTTRITAGTTWCTRCGAYTTRWPRRLAVECNGRPRTEAQRNILRRLSACLPPTTADYLADVAADNGGLREGMADHQAEKQWRQQAAAGDNCRRRDQIAAVNIGSRAATPPTGRYARLRGGALHPDTVSMVLPNGAAGSSDAAPAQPARRDVENGTVEEAAIGGKADICRPAAHDSWTRRTVTSTLACASLCGICRAPTRTACRGCDRALCIACARQRRPCQSRDAGGDIT